MQVADTLRPDYPHDSSPNPQVSLLQLLPIIVGDRSLDSGRDLCGSALLQLNKRGVPQRVQVLFPPIEAHLNTVAATILRETDCHEL